MGSALRDLSSVQHNDLVTVPDGRQPVRDNNTGDPPAVDGFHHIEFRFGIQRAGGLIQDDDRRILRKRTGDFQPLPLSAGKVFPVFDQLSLVASRPLHNILMDLRVPGSADHFRILYGGIPHPDIVGNGIFKQNDLLFYHGNRSRKDRARDFPDRFPVKQDLAGPRLIKARDQLAYRGFPASGRSDDRHTASGFHFQGEFLNIRLSQRGITECNIFQFYLTGQFDK